MEFSEFKKFIEKIDKELKDASFALDKRILARAVKLSEEMGELCNAVLAHDNNQRKEKMEQYSAENASEEFADIIITAFLLAKAMDVDVEKGLATKIEKIKKRFNI